MVFWIGFPAKTLAYVGLKCKNDKKKEREREDKGRNAMNSLLDDDDDDDEKVGIHRSI